MGNVFINDTILSDIAEAIRSKTGKTDLLLPSEMPAEIESITTGSSSDSSGSDSGSSGSTGSSGDSSGGSSSSGSGSSGDSSGGSTGELIIADGFTINFYDTDNVMIESHSAKFGFLIDKPISYNVDGWQNSEGTIYSFPLSVTSDMGAVATNLYAIRATRCEDIIYEFYEVSKNEYPFLLVIVGTLYEGSYYSNIFFMKVLPTFDSVSGNWSIINALWHKNNNSIANSFDMSTITFHITQDTSDLSENNTLTVSNNYCYGNFESEGLTGRLDETAYTEPVTE